MGCTESKAKKPVVQPQKVNQGQSSQMMPVPHQIDVNKPQQPMIITEPPKNQQQSHQQPMLKTNQAAREDWAETSVADEVDIGKRVPNQTAPPVTLFKFTENSKPQNTMNTANTSTLNSLASDIGNLYVIAAVFNPAKFKSRIKLYQDFKQHMSRCEVNLVTIECAFDNEPFMVTQPNKEPFDIQVRSKTVMWFKENLINVAISKLPNTWKYVAWIDADITFLDLKWPLKTVQALQKYPVVQLFRQAIDGGKNGERMKTDDSFGFYKVSNLPIKKSLFATYYPHPGYAWAATRKAIEGMGGLVDVDIVGSADLHMSFGFLGRILETVEGKNTSPEFIQALLAWQEKAQAVVKGKIGYVDVVIKHNWHGDKKNRKYVERWSIIENHGFNPKTDLTKNKDGLWVLTDKKPKMHQELREYFVNRKEDE
jgi:hypothetical protein